MLFCESPRLRSTCPPLPQAGCSGAINPQGNYITKQKYKIYTRRKYRNTKVDKYKIRKRGGPNKSSVKLHYKTKIQNTQNTQQIQNTKDRNTKVDKYEIRKRAGCNKSWGKLHYKIKIQNTHNHNKYKIQK